MKARTFDELFDIAERIRNDNRKTDGTEKARTEGELGLLFSPEQTTELIVRNPSGRTDEGGRNTQPNNGNRKVERTRGGLDSRPESELVPGARNDNVNQTKGNIGGRESNPSMGGESDRFLGHRRSESPSSSERSGNGTGTSTNERGTDGGTDVGRGRPVESVMDSKRGSSVRKSVLLKAQNASLTPIS